MLRLTIVLLLPLTVASSGVCEANGIELTLMSFNVRWEGLDKGRNEWANRRPVAVAMIKECAPDVVGLQEPSARQTRKLDEALAEYASFRGDHQRDETITFLYRSERFLLERGGSFWLVEESELSGGTRRCVWVHLRDKESGQGFYVFNNHFDHRSPESRQQSARALIRGIQSRQHADPFAALGDFNEFAHGSAMRFLRGGILHGKAAVSDKPEVALVDTFLARYPTRLTAASGHGFVGKREGVRIDFIFVREQDEILDAQIIHYNKDGLYPSDHYPVTARVRMVSADNDQ